MKERDKKRKTLRELLTYAYLRKIKRWIFCPNCGDGKMKIDKNTQMWVCEDCEYKLAVKEFENDYIFWFCDECRVYLNNQEGFDIKSDKHICQKCGYENDTTFNNIKNSCLDCGKIIADNETLCEQCKQRRKDSMKSNLLKVRKAIGVVAAVGEVVLINNYSCEKLSGLHGDNWFDNATDEELENERENIRKIYCQSGDDLELATLTQNLLYKFDDEIRKRSSIDMDGNSYGIKREHGWYLPNDD